MLPKETASHRVLKFALPKGCGVEASFLEELQRGWKESESGHRRRKEVKVSEEMAMQEGSHICGSPVWCENPELDRFTERATN